MNRLTPGMIVGRDVTTGRIGSMPLLRRGATFAAGYERHLQGAGIHAVWIDDDVSRGIDPVAPLSPETRKAAQEATARSFREVQHTLSTGGTLPDRALDAMRELASRIAQEVGSCAPAAMALEDLASADAYTHRHSVQVTVLGLLIGAEHLKRHGWVDARGTRRFDRLEERLGLLGFGLLIHDIGKLAIPAEILNKPGRLTDEEWEIMRSHPMAGIELLPRTSISALALSVVRNHHERWDGGGYPDGRAGDAIHIFARIATVADVYDAITSERPYRSGADPHVAVRIILEGSGTAFDPEVIDTFRGVVMPFPVGHTLELPDGRTGIVASVDPEDPDRPVVRILTGGAQEEEQVDLSALVQPHAVAA